MITTVTLNPSIDVSYPINKLKIDTVNRTDKVSKTAGGKGLNVSRVLNDLKTDLVATGVLGGYFGDFIKNQLDEDKIPNHFSSISQETRSCIAILHEGQQTEILEAGPQVTDEEINHFISLFTDLAKNSDVITISGSMVKGFPKTTYSKLIKIASTNNAKVLLDTSGDNLYESLLAKDKPYLIKPNTEELAGLLEQEIDSKDHQAIKAALENELFSGIPLIVVSLGADGALVKYQNTYYSVKVPTIQAVNPVGSGDSTIAGLAYAIDQKESIENIIKTGMACGVLNTLNPQTGKIDTSQLDITFNQIKITKL